MRSTGVPAFTAIARCGLFGVVTLVLCVGTAGIGSSSAFAGSWNSGDLCVPKSKKNRCEKFQISCPYQIRGGCSQSGYVPQVHCTEFSSCEIRRNNLIAQGYDPSSIPFGDGGNSGPVSMSGGIQDELTYPPATITNGAGTLVRNEDGYAYYEKSNQMYRCKPASATSTKCQAGTAEWIRHGDGTAVTRNQFNEAASSHTIDKQGPDLFAAAPPAAGTGAGAPGATLPGAGPSAGGDPAGAGTDAKNAANAAVPGPGTPSQPKGPPTSPYANQTPGEYSNSPDGALTMGMPGGGSSTTYADGTTVTRDASGKIVENGIDTNGMVVKTKGSLDDWRGNAGEGDCGTSETIDGKYGCGGTRATVDGAKITNQATQIVGSAATQVIGQVGQARAMAEGTQSAALYAAGDTQVTAGKIQVGTGAVNTALGVVQLVQASAHSSDATSIVSKSKNLTITNTGKDKTQSGEGKEEGDHGYMGANKADRVGTGIVENFRLNQGSNVNLKAYDVEKARALDRQMLAAGKTTDYAKIEEVRRQTAIDQKEYAIKSQARQIGRTAAGEQTKMAKEATAGGMMSLITGVSQFVQGGLSIAAGNALKDAAGALKTAENTALGGNLPGFDNLAGDDASAPRGSTVITGDGEDPNASEAAGDPTDTKVGDLGRGFNPNGPPPAGTPPLPPGAFTKKSNEGAPGGGAGAGMGGGGSGGTSPATEGQGDPSAKYAEMNRNQGNYDVGGGAFSNGGGGGGGGKDGMDLSALAALLPKSCGGPGQGACDEGQKNGILDFGGARDPAGEQPISLLDRNTNIFKRIHQTYQEKNQRGFVGVF